MLINPGASVVMVGLTFVVFDSIFEDMRRNAVQEHPDLNHDQLVAHIAAARGRQRSSGMTFPAKNSKKPSWSGPICWT